MARQRKGKSGHDKVVPLSLPEVQYCVANSIQGDAIDEEAVQRALQGYQLVLQGSLRDKSGVVTREITGHSGYYRNVMRGVAQVFGVEKRSEEAASVMRGAYLRDENEESEVDSFDIEDTEPAPKKRNVTREVSVFAQEQNAEASTRKETSPSARKDRKGVPALDTTESKEDGNLAKVSNETNLSTHSTESPQTRSKKRRKTARKRSLD